MSSRPLIAPTVIAEGNPLRAWQDTSVSISSISILGASFLAMGLVQIATLQGVGITPDSAIYIDAARHLAKGWGFMQSSPVGAPVPVTHYPPGYSLVLTLLMTVAQVDAPEAARLLGTLLIGLNVILVGDLVTRYSRFAWAGPIAALLSAFSLDMLRVHATGWSESLFLTLCLLYMRNLSVYLASPRPRLLIVTALLAAAATLTRYVGITLVASGFLAVLLLQNSNWRRRIIAAIGLACTSSVVVGMWCLRNLSTAHTATNRGFRPAPLTIEEWNDSAVTIARWYYPFAHDIFASRAIASVALVIMVIVLVFHNRLTEDHHPIGRRGNRLEHLPQVLLLFIVVYVSTVLGAIALVDHSTPLDWRILIPVFACGIVLHLCVVGDLLQQASARIRTIYVVSAATLAALYCFHAAPWVLAASWDDKGFNSPEWRHSSVLAYLRNLPGHPAIFSNAPPAIRFHNERGSYSIPRPAITETGEVCWDLQQVKQLRDRIAARHGLLVIFNARPAPDRGEKQLVRMLGAKRIYHGEEGSVYQLRESATPVKAPVSPAF